MARLHSRAAKGTPVTFSLNGRGVRCKEIKEGGTSLATWKVMEAGAYRVELEECGGIDMIVECSAERSEVADAPD